LQTLQFSECRMWIGGSGGRSIFQNCRNMGTSAAIHIQSEYSFLGKTKFISGRCRPLAQNTQLPRIAVKENMDAHGKYHEISDDHLPGRDLLRIGIYRKTTAVEFMAADKIYGKRHDKGQQHGIDDQCGRSWIKTDDQGESCDKLQQRHNDGNQVDEQSREKAVPVNDFSKNSRCQNLVRADIYKNPPKNPACCQINPGAAKKSSDGFIQSDTLPFPTPVNRR